MTTTTLRKVQTLRGYTSLSRFMAALSEEPVTEIPRQIATPYVYSPTHPVFGWGDRRVIIAETAHLRYEVYEVL